MEKITITTAGKKAVVTQSEHVNTHARIQMLPDGKYMNLDTGEIKEIRHHEDESRGSHISNMYRTFRTIRSILDANITDTDHTLAITLTYAEPMNDTKKATIDFKRFRIRIKNYCKRNHLSVPEYIVIFEPQASGSWHMHVFFIWTDMNAPYIPHDKLTKYWKNGFTTIRRVHNITNIGSYFTFSLANLDLDANISNLGKKAIYEGKGRKVETKQIYENGQLKSKWIIKGERIKYYPTGFNIYRCSKGIKRPIVETITAEELEERISDKNMTKVHEYGIQVIDNSSGAVVNNLIKEFYTID